MAKIVTLISLISFLALLAGAPAAQQPPDPARYDPNELLPREKQEETDLAQIREKLGLAVKEEDEPRQPAFQLDCSRLVRPRAAEEFQTSWHFPPKRQWWTNTCWSFSTVSFLESECHRQTGQSIKLSEMYPVYWEYLEKVREWVRTKGQSLVAEGSQSRAVLRCLQEHGIVRESDYPGILPGQTMFDHGRLIEELQSYLAYIAANGYWDEARVLAYTRALLDKYIGPPPAAIEVDGQSMTPAQYLREVVRVDPAAFVEFMSFLYVPFWTRGDYRVPDNWWHGREYLNVPLDEWYGAIRQAVGRGFSVCIGGDVSESGYIGAEDVAVIPSFDLPQDAIGQEAREFRFFNQTSQDDHGIHIVGWKQLDGHDWYLVKDSSRSAQRGVPGYYFYRDDYIRLKMLTFVVHRDAVPELLARFEAHQPPAEEK